MLSSDPRGGAIPGRVLGIALLAAVPEGPVGEIGSRTKRICDGFCTDAVVVAAAKAEREFVESMRKMVACMA
jgi:hypothetical protein